MANVLEIQNVSKKYPGGVLALDSLTLAVEAGSIFGLLGPNGSGKTTTLGIVLDVLRATRGTFSWFGQPISPSTKRRLGAMLETPNFYPYLSARQNLNAIAQIKQTNPQQISSVLETVGLLPRQHSAFKEFSLGMKQRLALAATLLGDPQVLVLDEPTNGLDPQGIAEVREIIQKVAAQGKTIILASHLLDEVQKVCTHVAVLQAGKLKRTGRVDTLLARHDQVMICTENLSAALTLLPQLPQVSQFRQEGEQLLISLNSSFTSADLNQAFFQRGIILSELRLQKNSLETEFLNIISARNSENP